MADIYIVTGNKPLWVKKEGSATAEDINVISPGDTITVSEISFGWYHCIGGWVYGFDQAGNSVLSLVSSGAPDNKSTNSLSDPKNQSLVSTFNYPYYSINNANSSGDGSSTYNSYMSILNKEMNIKNLRGIHGIPYQFMPIADRRIDSGPGAFGRKYAEKIIAKMPLLLMTPGTPEFLSGYSETERKGVIEYALNIFSDKSKESDLDSLLKREGRYYSLKTDWVAYYNHVNPLCRACARFLNIQDKKIDGIAADSYDWSNNTNKEIHKSLAYKGSIPFYIHSDTQISHSFNNSTSESMLAGKINGMSDLGREMNFLLGGAGALTGMEVDKYTKMSDMDKHQQNVKDMANKLANGNNLISSIGSSLQTVISGGKLIFPEIWSDSSYSIGYDVNIKLITPDSDKFSWFLNIAVPLMHLMALACPKQAGPNGYISPFLVRAFYKGLFNCDMGIVTNMNVNKGKESSWTKDGLPTVVDVSFSLKDLYSVLAITNNKSITNGIMNNIALMDYIANFCGVNINEPDIKRTIDMYYAQNFKNKATDFIKLDIAGGLDQWATGKVLNLFNRR